AAIRITSKGGQEIERRLARFVAANEDIDPLLSGFGLYLESSTIERFEFERAPDGSRWKPSIRAKTEGGKTLYKSPGGLRDSITHLVHSRSVEVGTNKIYAGVHQHGATIRAKNGGYLAFRLPGGLGFRKVKEVEIPARPFLGLSGEDETELLALTEDYEREALGGAA
ncbi:MAG: phage virion morphogenesis protein, partial [Betaproteobacteria bacterium]|nr:phage virion morphogenesis protein [Betaproteobacteria bacterium]